MSVRTLICSFSNLCWGASQMALFTTGGASSILRHKKNDREDGVNPAPFSKDRWGKWGENGKKGSLSIWRKLSWGTEEERQMREASSSMGVALSWTSRATVLNNFGKGIIYPHLAGGCWAKRVLKAASEVHPSCFWRLLKDLFPPGIQQRWFPVGVTGRELLFNRS